MGSGTPTLGTLLRNLRTRNGWTLKEMSQRVQIPLSTLSKVEHDRLTLTYDKLQAISKHLNIRLSELFAEDDADPADKPVTARRSVARIEDALRVATPNYDYFFLCTELRRKRMIPLLTRIRARSRSEFGELVRHPGEEYVHVLEGAIQVHTEFYDPVTLVAGQGIYIDSDMGHAYVVAGDFEEALVLGVCSSPEEDLVGSFFGTPSGSDSN